MTGSAVISGTVVVDDETRAPVRRSTVTLSRAGIEDIRTTASDDRGRFTFDRLPAGSYSLSAAKGSYLVMSYGAPKPGMPGGPIVLTEGQTFTAMPIALWRGAVIAGRLLDRAGQPVSGAQVEANQIIVVNGERRRRTAGRPAAAVTNAHGEYRIHGLLPGDYIVSSSPPPLAVHREATAAELAWANGGAGPVPPQARAFTYAPTMFPGTAEAAAGVVITLGRGEERLGLDFALQFVPVARVTGVVTGPDGRPVPDVVVFCSVKGANSLLPSSGVPISRVAADGSFSCPGLIPGQYTLAVRGAAATMPPAQAAAVSAGLAPPPLWGLTDVTVAGQDMANVAIRLQTGMSVSGQVALASATNARADLMRFQIRLSPAAFSPIISGSPTAAVGADGTFRVDGVIPASYRLAATAPAGNPAGTAWSLRSALLGSSDVIDLPFEVTPGRNVSGLVVILSDAQTELSGSLTDRAGRPAAQVYVFVFPTDRSMWTPASRRVQVVRSAENGTYAIAGVPAGEYYLCALTEVDMELRFEPSYLEQFIASAIKITLGEGEKRRQDLRVGR